MTSNLFNNAKFGDMFLTTENKQAVFLRFAENAEYEFAILYVEGWGNVQVFRHNGKEIYNDAAHSIVSKQEEPVSEPNKELAETYLAVFDKKFPVLPTLKGKQLADYKNFLNKCQQIFSLKEWGIRPIQSKLFEKLTLLWAVWGAEHLQGVGRQDEKEQDIPVSEELVKVDMPQEDTEEWAYDNKMINIPDVLNPLYQCFFIKEKATDKRWIYSRRRTDINSEWGEWKKYLYDHE